VLRKLERRQTDGANADRDSVIVRRLLRSQGLMARSSAKLIVQALGVTQILAWRSSFYLPACWRSRSPLIPSALTWVVGGLSLSLLVSGVA
jgi:hypothetical protein